MLAQVTVSATHMRDTGLTSRFGMASQAVASIWGGRVNQWVESLSPSLCHFQMNKILKTNIHPSLSLSSPIPATMVVLCVFLVCFTNGITQDLWVL